MNLFSDTQSTMMVISSPNTSYQKTINTEVYNVKLVVAVK